MLDLFAEKMAQYKMAFLYARGMGRRHRKDMVGQLEHGPSPVARHGHCDQALVPGDSQRIDHIGRCLLYTSDAADE